MATSTDGGIAIITRNVTRMAALLCTAAAVAIVPAAPAAATTALTTALRTALTAAPVVDVDLATSVTAIEDYLVSQPFSTSAGDELLVAMFSADGPNSPGLHQEVVEVTGCGLAWTEAGQANDLAGVAAVFTAWATGTVTDCEVSGELLYPFDGMVHIVSFTGADPSIASVRQYSDPWSGAGFGAVHIPADNSLVYQVGHNWSVAETPYAVVALDTSGPPQNVPASLLSTYLSGLGDTSYVARIDGPLAATPVGTDRYANLAVWFTEPGLINSVSFAVVPAT
jgi:hypothetical protein